MIASEKDEPLEYLRLMIYAHLRESIGYAALLHGPVPTFAPHAQVCLRTAATSEVTDCRVFYGTYVDKPRNRVAT